MIESAEVGKIGEDIASNYLKNKGFSIVTRNYRKKYGEIDIIAYKVRKLHFIEVKTVTHIDVRESDVPRETSSYRAEDNVHPWKLKRLSRTISAYLGEKNLNGDEEWQFDVITIQLNVKAKTARINFIKDIIL